MTAEYKCLDSRCYCNEKNLFCEFASEFGVCTITACVKNIEHDVVKTSNPTNDTVNHPDHYTRGGIECIAAIRASMTSDGFCDYCKGNALKYLWRWRDKGGVEDLKKARVYLDWLIEEADK